MASRLGDLLQRRGDLSPEQLAKEVLQMASDVMTAFHRLLSQKKGGRDSGAMIQALHDGLGQRTQYELQQEAE